MELIDAQDRADGTSDRHELPCMDPLGEEHFPLTVIIVNNFTEPHKDSGGWHGGMAWMKPFGNFQGAHLACHELQRLIPYQPGSIAGICGDVITHSVTRWFGTNRYSVVRAFHHNMKH